MDKPTFQDNPLAFLVSLKDAVTHGDRRATIGQELLTFAEHAQHFGMPRATCYGVASAGRMLRLAEMDGSHSTEFGFPDDVYRCALALLDVARDALAHAREDSSALPIRYYTHGESADAGEQCLISEAGRLLNGARVHRSENGKVMFIALPEALQHACGGCSCAYCTPDRAERNPNACWDALAISTDENRSHAWTVHAPELHGAKLKRTE